MSPVDEDIAPGRKDSDVSQLDQALWAVGDPERVVAVAELLG